MVCSNMNNSPTKPLFWRLNQKQISWVISVNVDQGNCANMSKTQRMKANLESKNMASPSGIETDKRNAKVL